MKNRLWKLAWALLVVLNAVAFSVAISMDIDRRRSVTRPLPPGVSCQEKIIDSRYRTYQLTGQPITYIGEGRAVYSCNYQVVEGT